MSLDFERLEGIAVSKLFNFSKDPVEWKQVFTEWFDGVERSWALKLQKF